MAVGELRKRSLEADHTTTAVDFDLALKELEEKEFVDTGPLEAVVTRPGSDLIFTGVYSKREYVYLTEKGYKAAR
jgi:hypothetical protein